MEDKISKVFIGEGNSEKLEKIIEENKILENIAYWED